MTAWTWIRTVYEWGGPVTWTMAAISFGLLLAIGFVTSAWWGATVLVDGSGVAMVAIFLVVVFLCLAWSASRNRFLERQLRLAVNSRHMTIECDHCGRLLIQHTDREMEDCMVERLDLAQLRILPEGPIAVPNGRRA